MTEVEEASPYVEKLEERLRPVLQELTEEEVEGLLDALSSLEINIVSEPSTGLVMLRVKDCFGRVFNFGEALVTQVEVEFEGVSSHATALGESRQKAVLAASISVINRKGNLEAEIFAAFEEYLVQCEKRVNKLREQEEKLVEATKVDFESMAEER